MGKIKRLSKVAREFNVGINTIGEFLVSKGLEHEISPNAKIDEATYAILLAEFQSEKSTKEESKNVAIGTPKETILIKKEPAAPATPDKDVKKEEPVAEEKEAKKETENANVEIDKKEVKVIGKIDLNPVKKAPAPAAEKKEEEPAPPPPTPEVPKKEKKETIPSKPENISTKVEALAGPKIIGKIEVKEKTPTKKPVASSLEGGSGKKKRKRIQRTNTKEKTTKTGGATNSPPKKSQETIDKEIQEQIKETLAKLTGRGKNKGAKHRKEKREAVSEQIQKNIEQAEIEKKILKATEYVTVSELASMMDLAVNEVIGACMSLGMFVSINQRLDAETLSIIAEEFGYSVEFVSATEESNLILEEVDDPKDLKERAPIVTIMGHVDHGKTSLLDYIRKTNIIAGESGGITQHIGAYSVELENKKHITFLDTPGHEAFTAMRARGTQVTDIAIIVISADDSIMPQTKEAINHAQAADVPLIFAFNKIDKPDANPDKIKEELSAMNILVEDWGGKHQSQEISALKGTGVQDLLEKILLETEMLELKANPNKNAIGTVIESELDKGRGYVTTLLVQEGTLKIGDFILSGSYSGKIKAMFNERQQKITEAIPSTPVLALGLNNAPDAGERFHVLNDEKEAKKIAERRLQLQREQGVRTKKHITLDEIGRRLAIGDFKELNIIIKGDVNGSIEALSDSLEKLSTEQIQVNIILKSVGQISESDIMLAAASEAIIIGFQVRPSINARRLAAREQIDIRLYSIIYDAVEEIKDAMEGMLAPKFEEKVTATIEIRETFKISKIGTIAGCFVKDGKISRNSSIRVIREGIVIHTGKLGSLKRFKDDVKEVSKDYECGLNIDKFNDIQVQDIVEAYEQVEIKQKLNK